MINRCPVSYAHQPHDHCDGTPAHTRPRVAVDAKRSHFPATVLVDSPDIHLDEPQEPGAIRPFGPNAIAMACPGCGVVSAMDVGHPKPAHSPSWDIAAGDIEHPETLTLRPSIDCRGCCKWHGYLTNGEYVSC